jgi:hypothetical protein
MEKRQTREGGRSGIKKGLGGEGNKRFCKLFKDISRGLCSGVQQSLLCPSLPEYRLFHLWLGLRCLRDVVIVLPEESCVGT